MQFAHAGKRGIMKTEKNIPQGPSRKSQSIAATRAFLRELKRKPSLIESRPDIELERIEAAAHIVQATKTLWFVATSAKLEGLAHRLETAFCDAYLVAGGKPSILLASIGNGHNKTPCQQERTT
jgi:hypothetical protein